MKTDLLPKELQDQTPEQPSHWILWLFVQLEDGVDEGYYLSEDDNQIIGFYGSKPIHAGKVINKTDSQSHAYHFPTYTEAESKGIEIQELLASSLKEAGDLKNLVSALVSYSPLPRAQNEYLPLYSGSDSPFDSPGWDGKISHSLHRRDGSPWLLSLP